MKILVFGDIVGRIGREAVMKTLPDLRSAYAPDLVIANCENLARGKGVTEPTVRQMLDAGVDLLTSGNHLWDKKDVFAVLEDRALRDRLIRPANYPREVPGEGWKILTVGTKNVLVVNLLGRVYSRVHTDDPFRKFDAICAEAAPRKPTVVLVDFHGDATSEKVAFGWFAAGRASAVWGTHTHVPTKDARILEGGTAYITDVGMSGYSDGVLGVAREPIIRNFTTQLPVRHEIPDTGPAAVNAVVITIGSDGKAEAIEHIERNLTIP